MPDLDVQTGEDGPTRVFALLHDARPVLLDLGAPGRFDVAPWADEVRLVAGSHEGTWELPLLGQVPAPSGVLIRPDGHVAWAGELPDAELTRLARHVVLSPSRVACYFLPSPDASSWLLSSSVSQAFVAVRLPTSVEHEQSVDLGRHQGVDEVGGVALAQPGPQRAGASQ